MKSELRIGNLLMVGNYDVKVIEIHHLGVQVCDLEETQDTWELYTDRIKPIPLTEEWLLKFDGFIKDGEYLSIGRLDCKYCFKYRDLADNWAFYIEYTDGRPTDDGVKYPVAFDIKYVHQLQNLYFSITREELTLKSE
jgi:hypothetical protein